jgi:hypothetical protein
VLALWVMAVSRQVMAVSQQVMVVSQQVMAVSQQAMMSVITSSVPCFEKAVTLSAPLLVCY